MTGEQVEHEQCRDESRDLRKDLLFAAQHQRRVAALQVGDIWHDSMEELTRGMREAESEARRQMGRRGADDGGGSAAAAAAAASDARAPVVQRHHGPDGPLRPSAAYERALRVLANSSRTTVAGLEKFRTQRVDAAGAGAGTGAVPT